jgi:hypothetical protein
MLFDDSFASIISGYKMVSKGALSLIILVEANWCCPFSCSLIVGCTAQLHNFLAPTSW